VVTATKNELQRLQTLLFSIEFSDYSDTIVSKLSLCSFHDWSIWNLLLRLNRSPYK